MGSSGVGRAGAEQMQIAVNRLRQRELYGCPLGDRVHRLTARLGITQARLARTLGVSPAMLSQLVSGRRVKIGHPAVLARLQLLDRSVPDLPGGRAAVDALLAEVARAQPHWTAGDGAPGPAQALRALAPPARLAAAAATLAPAFPELAELLWQAAEGERAG
jgi:transcriptional regulator with XRE-family HTH domain